MKYSQIPDHAANLELAILSGIDWRVFPNKGDQVVDFWDDTTSISKPCNLNPNKRSIEQ